MFLLSGCIPAPLLYMSYGKTGLDAISIMNGNKTTTDAFIFGITDKDCNTHHLLDGEDYCEEQKYLDE